MNNRWERRGVLWPVLLILAGGILLLNNIGQLDWSLWELLFRLWPAILLAAGIELLVPTRSAASYFVTVLLVLAVFVGSFLLLEASSPRSGGGAAFEESLSNDDPVTLVLEPVIGALNLRAGASSGLLVEGSLPVDSDDGISVQRSERAGRHVLRISRDWGSRRWIVFPFTQEAWDLTATSQVPLELQVDMAVGLIDLDLTGLDVPEVDAGVGVGEIRLELSDTEAEVSLDGGVGSLRLVLPAGASARLEISRGLATLNLPADYDYADGVATSPAARSGAPELEIQVNLGVGLISIVEAGG